MQSSSQAHTIHRYTKIGESLMETLTELKQKHQLTEHQEAKILSLFDNIMIRLLSNTMNLPKGHMKGHLKVYNNCDNVWSFILQNVQISTEQIDMMSLNLLKIITVEKTTENPDYNRKNNKKKNKAHSHSAHITTKSKQIIKNKVDKTIQYMSKD